MVEIFGLDMGNKRVKMESSKRTKIYPAYFINEEEFGNNEALAILLKQDKKNTGKTSKYKINKESKVYRWGEDLDTTTVNNILDTLSFGLKRYTDTNFRKLVSMALVEMAKDFSFEQQLEVKVVTGLPTDDFDSEECKKAINEAMMGIHTVNIDGKDYTVKVKDVEIMAQPTGTLVDFLVGENESDGRLDLLQKKVFAISDNGGGTRLIDIVKKGNLEMAKRKQSPLGAFTLYERIANKVKKQYSANYQIDIDSYIVEKILRTAKEESKENTVYNYSPNGDDIINISELVNREIDEYTENVINDVVNTLSGFGMIFRILFTGGTTNLLNKDLIIKKFGKAALFVEKPEISTVKGYRKYGKIKWK